MQVFLLVLPFAVFFAILIISQKNSIRHGVYDIFLLVFLKKINSLTLTRLFAFKHCYYFHPMPHECIVLTPTWAVISWPWLFAVVFFRGWNATQSYGCFLKQWYPQIIHFNRVFYDKPSILGYPYFWKHPYRDCKLWAMKSGISMKQTGVEWECHSNFWSPAFAELRWFVWWFSPYLEVGYWKKKWVIEDGTDQGYWDVYPPWN